MTKLRYSMGVALIAACLALPSFSQTTRDEGYSHDSVFLNDGQVVTGTIIEDHPGLSPKSMLKIQVAPNDVRLIHYSTIAVIRRGSRSGG